MLMNNNHLVIDRMAKRSLLSNRRRSLIMLAAIVLSAFMVFSVFTIGITYFQMQRLQNIRLNGAEYDAILYGLTDEQREMCENNSDLVKTGIAAICGYAIETDQDTTINVTFMWADDTYWNEMMLPAREWVKGSYPQEADEVMVTESALKECGLEHLQVGDSFTVIYGDADVNNHTKEFRISGIWAGYGSKKVFYMSKEFYDQSGYELSNVMSGRYFMDFKQKIMTTKQQDDFITSMNLGKQQRLFFIADLGSSVPIFLGMLGIVLVTCFSAYLLIYNIMYLSVSGKIRYFGLLQTIGMTSQQIYRLMRRQILLMGSVGIAGGILIGGGVSFVLLPSVMKFLGIQTGQIGEVTISFHPLVFLLSIFLTAVTIYVGSRKPVKMAVSISPLEALSYRAVYGKKNTRKTGKGKLLWRMSMEKIIVDKKKSAVVMVSLAAGLSVFLCLITLIESQGARTIVSNYLDADMVIKNATLKLDDRQNWTQIIDQEFISGIISHEGVKEVHPVLCAEIIVPWESGFADYWMNEFYETWMSIPYADDLTEYQEHPENFGSFIIGIDDQEFEYLNETLESPADKNDFASGKICILYRNGLALSTDDVKGQMITCGEYENGDKRQTFEIAGLTDENYYTGELLGIPPTIIVSEKALNEFIEDPYISKISIRYQQEYDNDAEADMLALMNQSTHAKDFSYESKIEEMESFEKAQGNMMEVGIGIALILALIGILNYVNTVIGNIQNRQVELAILESVGMTGKQVNRMLAAEGLLYAGGSLLLTATVGVGITYVIYQTMNYRDVAFSIPIFAVVWMLVFILIVCTAIPLLTWKVISKQGAVVERIRGFD